MGHVKAEEGNVEEGAQWNKNFHLCIGAAELWQLGRVMAEWETLQGLSGFVGSDTIKDLEFSLDW